MDKTVKKNNIVFLLELFFFPEARQKLKYSVYISVGLL